MKDEDTVPTARQQLESGDLLESAPSSPAAHDGIDRRNFLSCMAWAGTGLLWTMAGGVPT
jgi:hypothetical protein